MVIFLIGYSFCRYFLVENGYIFDWLYFWSVVFCQLYHRSLYFWWLYCKRYIFPAHYFEYYLRILQ